MIRPILAPEVWHLRDLHVQLGDVPRTLDPAEAEGEFRQHDGVMTAMMKLPTQGFA